MCAEILRLAGRESAADAIRDLITRMNPQQGTAQEALTSTHQPPMATTDQSNNKEMSIPDIASNARKPLIRRAVAFRFSVALATLGAISVLAVWLFVIGGDAMESQRIPSSTTLNITDNDILLSQLPTPESTLDENIGVPIPVSGYGLARCGADSAQIYLFRYNTVPRKRHVLSLTWEQATSIWSRRGIGWGESIIDQMSDSECEQWPIGRPLLVSDFANIDNTAELNRNPSPASLGEAGNEAINNNQPDLNVESAIDVAYGRIVARIRNSDARLEFGWLPGKDTVSSSSDDRQYILPTYRFLAQNIEKDRWLSSSGIWINGRLLGAVNARRLERSNGEWRFEFSFKPQDGERIMPNQRYITLNLLQSRLFAQNEEWLQSDIITVPIGAMSVCIDLPIGQHVLSVPSVRDISAADLQAAVGNNGELMSVIEPGGIDLVAVGAFQVLWPLYNGLLSVEDMPAAMFECPKTGESIALGLEAAHGGATISAHRLLRLSSNSSTVYVAGRTGIDAGEIYLHRLHTTREDLVGAGCDLNEIATLSRGSLEYKLGLPVLLGEFSCR